MAALVGETVSLKVWFLGVSYDRVVVLSIGIGLDRRELVRIGLGSRAVENASTYLVVVVGSEVKSVLGRSGLPMNHDRRWQRRLETGTSLFEPVKLS